MIKSIKQNILVVCFIFSVSTSFSQGFKKNPNFYKEASFIELTRSPKPITKTLENYAAYTHHQQGGTCVGHAIAQGMTILNSIKRKSEIKKNNVTSSFSPYYTYLHVAKNFTDGCNMKDALMHVKENGSPLITYVEYRDFYPYSDNILNSLSKLDSKKYTKAKKRAKNYKLNMFEAINSIDGIKQSIHDGYPVLYGIDYMPIYFSLDKEFKLQIDPRDKDLEQWYDWNENDTIEEGEMYFPLMHGHAMLIVGYDDRKQAVRILNSWGEDWGDGGYFWMKYSDLFCSLIDYWELIDEEWVQIGWIDIGNGNVWNNTRQVRKLNIDEINNYVYYYESILAERGMAISLNRGNGFGTEAYSMQGIDFNNRASWYDDDNNYIPQSIRESSPNKTKMIETVPELKNSRWFNEFDTIIKEENNID